MLHHRLQGKVCLHTYIYSYIHKYIHTYVYIDVYTHAYVCEYPSNMYKNSIYTNNIYIRSKDRLIGSYRKRKNKLKSTTTAQISSEITESVGFDVHSAAHPTNLTSLPAISPHEPNLESHVEIVPPMAIGPIENSSRIVVPYTVRDDDLDPEERDFA
jgi:hypothetical protein